MYFHFFLGNAYARCSICGIDISVAHGGRNDVTKHVSVKNHQDMARASSSNYALSTFYDLSKSLKVIEADTRWALFVAHHNLVVIMQQGSLIKYFLIQRLLRTLPVVVQSVLQLLKRLLPHTTSQR